MFTALKLLSFALAFLNLPHALFAQTAPVKCPAQPTRISIDRGTFSSQPGVTFRLRHFQAALVPLGKALPDCLNKMTVLSHGEIFVSNESLTQVFADKLGQTESKIKDFKVVNGVEKVTLSGKIVKLIPIAFSIEGPVTTDGTSLLVVASRIKADGIPVKAMLGLVGDHLSSVFNMRGVGGVQVTENTLSFQPEQIAHLKGHIQSVQTTNDGLILRYSTPAAHTKHKALSGPPASTPPVGGVR